MLGAAGTGLAGSLSIKSLLLLKELLIQTGAIGLRDDLVEELDAQVALTHIGDAGLSQKPSKRRKTQVGLRRVPGRWEKQ
jgi:hypothetical protein